MLNIKTISARYVGYINVDAIYREDRHSTLLTHYWAYFQSVHINDLWVWPRGLTGPVSNSLKITLFVSPNAIYCIYPVPLLMRSVIVFNEDVDVSVSDTEGTSQHILPHALHSSSGNSKIDF